MEKFYGKIKEIKILYDSFVQEVYFPNQSLRSFNLIIEKDAYIKITPISDKDYLKYKDEYDLTSSQTRFLNIEKEKEYKLIDDFEKYFSKKEIFDEDDFYRPWNICLVNYENKYFNYRISELKANDETSIDLIKSLKENLSICEFEILN